MPDSVACAADEGPGSLSRVSRASSPCGYLRGAEQREQLGQRFGNLKIPVKAMRDADF
jgi:hypothetical protein